MYICAVMLYVYSSYIFISMSQYCGFVGSSYYISTPIPVGILCLDAIIPE